MKIELELPDKPEVHAIAAMLNIDPDCVVGKLIRVWQWFDKHTVDGNAFGVTYALPDRITNVTGFGEAMMFVGWLEQNGKTLTMPKFDRHTSKSAKKRALTANRVNKSRNADVTLDALPREEKRRVNTTPKPPCADAQGFDEFWSAYPRKEGKQTARKAWGKINPDLQVVLSALAWQKKTQEWTKDGGAFVPHASSYLNGARWEDERTEQTIGAGKAAIHPSLAGLEGAEYQQKWAQLKYAGAI